MADYLKCQSAMLAAILELGLLPFPVFSPKTGGGGEIGDRAIELLIKCMAVCCDCDPFQIICLFLVLSVGLAKPHDFIRREGDEWSLSRRTPSFSCMKSCLIQPRSASALAVRLPGGATIPRASSSVSCTQTGIQACCRLPCLGPSDDPLRQPRLLLSHNPPDHDADRPPSLGETVGSATSGLCSNRMKELNWFSADSSARSTFSSGGFAATGIEQGNRRPKSNLVSEAAVLGSSGTAAERG
jgi:hypothetical protein